MKKAVILIVYLALSLPVTMKLAANPFACSMERQKIQKPGSSQTALSYIGYARMENQQFAIIQLKNNQLILKQGETAGKVKIIRFTADSLVYKENNTIFSLPIYTNKLGR